MPIFGLFLPLDGYDGNSNSNAEPKIAKPGLHHLGVGLAKQYAGSYRTSSGNTAICYKDSDGLKVRKGTKDMSSMMGYLLN